MFDKKAFGRMLSIRFHHGAWPLVLIASLVALLFHVLQWHFFKKIFIFASLFILYFFRNPKRYIADVPNSIVSPADGTIVEISETFPPEAYGLPKEKMQKIAIFLSPLNVHVNRIPIEGIIEQNIYTPGQFLNAMSHRSSAHNEQRGIVIKTALGQKILCIQVAGFIARRIICNVQRGDSVKKGGNYGIICFGSRVDLYVPQSAKLLVKVDQGLRAGESILGFVESEAPNS